MAARTLAASTTSSPHIEKGVYQDELLDPLSASTHKDGKPEYTEEDIPSSYQSTGTLRGYSTYRANKSSSSFSRPGYFDLQRLAVQADMLVEDAPLAHVGENETVSDAETISSRASIQTDEQSHEEHDPIPPWISDDARSLSRSSRVAASRASRSAKSTRPPSRTSMFSPKPRSFGARDVFDQGEVTPQCRLTNATEDDSDDIDEGNDQTAKESTLHHLAHLHQLTDEELDHKLETDLSCSGLSMSRNIRLPTSPRTSKGSTRSPNSTRGSLASAKEDAAYANRHKVLRTLSKAFQQAREERDTWREAYEEHMAKQHSLLSATKRRSEARELALRDILSSAGVSHARVDRALMHVDAQITIPVINADDKLPDHWRRPLATTPQREDRLPASLMEAMQDDWSDNVTKPTAVRASTAQGTHATHVSPSPTSCKDTAQQATLTTKGSASQTTPSSKAVAAAQASRASGLMGWGNTSNVPKAVASVQASGTLTPPKHDHLDPVDPLQTPRSNRSRAGSRSSVLSRAESQGERHEQDISPRSRGFGFFSTLGWRKKKPNPDTLVASKDPLSWLPSQADVPPSATIAEEDFDQHAGNSHAHENTLRARSSVSLSKSPPSLSGKDVALAIHDAIGSLPPSPTTERPQDISELPKPPHFKAIFLATRIMTRDPASVMVQGGKLSEPSIKSAAIDLVRTTRSQGTSISDSGMTGKGPKAPDAQHIVRDIDARASRPSQGSQGTGGASTAATLSKALSRYARSSPQQEGIPNVTRISSVLRNVSPSSAKAPQSTKALPTNKSEQSDKPSTPSAHSPPVATELEPMLSTEARPPTFTAMTEGRRMSFSSRRLNRKPPPEDDESSGDEFEVYGGKHLDMDQIQNLATSIHQHRDVDEGALLTDRYGFVYDATPADVRLLRRARREAIHAPACLTGIRVGVQARGGTESQSDEDKEDSDNEHGERGQQPGRAEETNHPGETETKRYANAKDAEDVAMAAEEPRISTSPTKGHALLSVSQGKPSLGAVDRNTASLLLNGSGPTSPEQEKLHFLGPNVPEQAPATMQPSASAATAGKPVPSASQTVRKLLEQLQAMHMKQQEAQKLEWNAFLEQRRTALRGKNEKLGGVQPHTTQASSLVGAVRKGSDVLGITSSVKEATPLKSKLGEEHWTMGALIGLSQMGHDSKDYAEFCKLIQKGVPLLYRPKVWYECSGAGEWTEPGRYQELLKEHENEENMCTNQIDLDVGRTMPTNVFFSGDGPGVPKLRRLLVAYSWYNPKCGYCQGMNNLAATLLLTHATEEEAFWVLVCIIERILPQDYFTSHLIVAQADQRVLIDLVHTMLPRLAQHIDDLGVDLPAVTFAWFLSLYTDCLPVELDAQYDVALVRSRYGDQLKADRIEERRQMHLKNLCEELGLDADGGILRTTDEPHNE